MKKKVIFIDCRYLHSGLGTVVSSMIPILVKKLLNSKLKYDYKIYILIMKKDKSLAKILFKESINKIEFIETFISPFSILNFISGFRYSFRSIFLIPHFTISASFLVSKKVIIMVHDILPFRENLAKTLPYLLSLKLAAIFKNHIIICPSRFTKRKLSSILPKRAKIKLAYNGCSSASMKKISFSNQENNYKYLIIGNLKPHKNINLALKTMQALYSKYGNKYKLDIIGSLFKTKKSEILISPNINYLGPVSDKELVLLMPKYTALIFPSRYEGFGLPVLESILIKLPVISLRIEVLIELFGETLNYIDNNVESLFEMIEKNNLIVPNDEVIKTFKDKYSWDKQALIFYKEIVTI